MIKERAARLRQAGETAFRSHLQSLVGTRQRILIEREGIGRAEDFTLASISGGEPGNIVEAEMAGHDGQLLLATPLCARAA